MSVPEAKILVVDDLPDWRETLGGLLTDEGYQVETAGSAAEALALLAGDSFAVAVLDMRLDETNENNTEGLELAQAIEARWPYIKIVIVTGYATQETVDEAMKPKPDLGGTSLAHEFVPKQDSNSLVEAVERALS